MPFDSVLNFSECFSYAFSCAVPTEADGECSVTLLVRTPSILLLELVFGD